MISRVLIAANVGDILANSEEIPEGDVLPNPFANSTRLEIFGNRSDI
jgi:hypothetical protein